MDAESGKKSWRNWRSYFTLGGINRVVKVLTLSDILMVGGFGLVAPIFAVFVTENIAGGTVAVVGIASAIHLVTRSLGQIPTAAILDKIAGERDDFWAMLIGSFLISATPLLYLIISTPLQLYLVQLLYGLSASITFPSWMAIFTRHIDSEHEGLEWGIYQTLVDLGSAGAASLGGLLAAQFGFSSLFVIVSIFSFVGSFALIAIYRFMRMPQD